MKPPTLFRSDGLESDLRQLRELKPTRAVRAQVYTNVTKRPYTLYSQFGHIARPVVLGALAVVFFSPVIGFASQDGKVLSPVKHAVESVTGVNPQPEAKPVPQPAPAQQLKPAPKANSDRGQSINNNRRGGSYDNQWWGGSWDDDNNTSNSGQRSGDDSRSSRSRWGRN